MADLHNPTKLMFFWGSNLASTSEEGQIYSQVGAQLKGGAKMIVVDPRKSELASHADWYCQIKPGTDVAFYNAMIHVTV